MANFGKELLKKIKETEILGEVAHAKYSPPYRDVLSYEEILEKNPKFAAINILLYLKNNEWYFPLIIRAHNKKDKHSGQVSFPGGTKENIDQDFSQTAIRETSEEIGIEKNYIRIIRELSPIYIQPSNFFVYPFVSYTKKNPKFTLQKNEATELIEFSVNNLIELNTTPIYKKLPTTKGIEVPIINYPGPPIWGATSMIMNEFRELLKKILIVKN